MKFYSIKQMDTLSFYVDHTHVKCAISFFFAIFSSFFFPINKDICIYMVERERETEGKKRERVLKSAKVIRKLTSSFFLLCCYVCYFLFQQLFTYKSKYIDSWWRFLSFFYFFVQYLRNNLLLLLILVVVVVSYIATYIKRNYHHHHSPLLEISHREDRYMTNKEE